MRTTLIFIYHLSVHKILFQFVIDFNTPNYVKNKICMQFAINVMYICCSRDTTKIYQRDVALCLQEMWYKSDQDFPAIFHFASCANDLHVPSLPLWQEVQYQKFYSVASKHVRISSFCGLAFITVSCMSTVILLSFVRNAWWYSSGVTPQAVIACGLTTVGSFWRRLPAY